MLNKTDMPEVRGGWRAYLIPAAVCQSLMIGGGYGTGREIVEFFSRYGMRGGLLGLGLVAGCFAVILAVSYEFARVFRAYDYRAFFRALLGRGWIAFEILYLAMFALVLAVICAAAGTLVENYLHLPSVVGLAVLLLAIVVFAFYGRKWVTVILTAKAAVLCCVVLVYFAVVGWRYHERIILQFNTSGVVPGWASGALRYALYASVIIPATLFTTRVIETRRQAVGAGILSGVAAILPAVLMHVSFAAGYPEVLAAQLPAYWMITALQMPFLTIAYIAVLFGSLFDVGLGFIQSVNERLDGWSRERKGRPLARSTRAVIAFSCVLVSGCLSVIGVVPLIARGYSAMAWGFLVLYVGPVLTIGVLRLRRGTTLPEELAKATG
jgi:uncharacterized membrane protein YkvI